MGREIEGRGERMCADRERENVERRQEANMSGLYRKEVLGKGKSSSKSGKFKAQGSIC